MKEDNHIWYTRPVLFVADIQQAAEFYVPRLGFAKKWHESDGKGTVCQVDRGGCEIILSEDKTRTDRTRLFLELSRKAVDELLMEVKNREIQAERLKWGYEVLSIKDPDGNELLICLENLL